MQILNRKVLDFHTFLKQKASEVGLDKCPNCGMDAYFFSISGVCSACNSQLTDFDEHLILQYSIEIIREFTDKYDELNPRFVIESVLISCDQLAGKLKNREMPTESEIKKLQALFVKERLGGGEFGGFVTIDHGQLGISINKDIPNHEELMLPLGALILAIKNILKLSTGNER